MDPTTVFCPNLACPASGQIGQGDLGYPLTPRHAVPVYRVS